MNKGKKTILLVEDEVFIIMAEKEILENFGYNVITANNGEEAVETFATMPAIDLVLMDINLGAGMDGTEAAALILRQRDIPVVFLSSHTEPEIVAKTEKITSYGYVVKGSGATVLQASIKMAFKLFEAKMKGNEKESRMEAALAALTKLNHFSIELSMLAAEDNLEAFIAKRIKEFTGAEAATFSEYNPANQTIIPKYIEIGPGLLEKVVGLLGKQINKIHYFVNTEMYQEMTSEIIGTRKTLHEASFGAISPPVGAAVQALLKVDRFIGVAYLIDGKLFGTSLLAMGKDQSDLPHEVLENFISLAAVSLSRKQAESQREAALEALVKSENRFRSIFESSRDAIMTLEPPYWKFSSGNPAAVKMFMAQDEADFADHEPWSISPERQPDGRASAEKAKAMIEIAMRDGSNFFEWTHKRITGEEFPATVLLTMMVLAEKKILQATVRDITGNKEAEEEIKRQLTEKEIMLREVHHRIKNNIASIGGIISLHLKTVTNPEAIAVLQDAIGRVDSMGILYDKLLLSEDYKDISVKKYVESLCDTVVALFSDNARIKLDKRIDDFQLDPKRLFSLGIIINELLTNKMKYAFINKDSGLIKISLENVKNQVTFTVQDNGNELPDGFDIDKSRGFGLKLVKILSKQLAANFSMENQAGTKCKIEFEI